IGQRKGKSLLEGTYLLSSITRKRKPRKFSTCPSANADYSKKLRESTLLAAKPERTIRVFEKMKIMHKKPKVMMEQKMTRIPKNELIDSLFGVFKKYVYLAFKGLATGGCWGAPGKRRNEVYSYEAPSLPLQKTRSSQLESSDMSEDTVRTSEPPGTSIP
ncbi:21981_t:CDS:2, partial [Gigaspora rosea]